MAYILGLSCFLQFAYSSQCAFQFCCVLLITIVFSCAFKFVLFFFCGFFDILLINSTFNCCRGSFELIILQCFNDVVCFYCYYFVSLKYK